MLLNASRVHVRGWLPDTHIAVSNAFVKIAVRVELVMKQVFRCLLPAPVLLFKTGANQEG
jgi:hypothetical protein